MKFIYFQNLFHQITPTIGQYYIAVHCSLQMSNANKMARSWIKDIRAQNQTKATDLCEDFLNCEEHEDVTLILEDGEIKASKRTA